MLVTHELICMEVLFALPSPSNFIRLLLSCGWLKRDHDVLSSAVGNKDDDHESQHFDADESVQEIQRERPKFGLASVLGKLDGDKDRKLGKYINFE